MACFVHPLSELKADKPQVSLLTRQEKLLDRNNHYKGTLESQECAEMNGF